MRLQLDTHIWLCAIGRDDLGDRNQEALGKTSNKCWCN